MATQTTHYNLVKPDITDKVDITQLNGNSDIIDQTLHDLEDNKQDNLNFDDEPKDGSQNPVTSDGLKKAFDKVQSSLKFDEQPTAGSDNPVKSKGIKSYVDKKVSEIDVSEQLATKQDKLSWDNSPKPDSQNPVTSNGIYNANQALSEGMSDLRQQFGSMAAGLIWQEAVANFAAISTTYDAPEKYWAVTVKDTGYTYVYDGSTWVLALINTVRFFNEAEAREILEG